VQYVQQMNWTERADGGTDIVIALVVGIPGYCDVAGRRGGNGRVPIAGG